LNNPAELIELIEDIETEIASWNTAVSEINVDSLKSLSDFNDCRSSLQSRVIYLEDEVHDNNEQADKLKSRKLKLTQHIAGTSKQVANTKHAAGKLLEHVSGLLAHWCAEEKKARAWEKKARENLNCAQSQLLLAKGNLSQAQDELAYASSQLRICNNSGYTDQHGVYHHPNCTAESTNVGRCRGYVERYQAEVGTAQTNVSICLNNLKDAQTRLDICVKNVQVTSLGMSEAESAQSIADNAVHCSVQTDKALQAVNTRMDEIIVNQSKQRKCLDDMHQAVHQCKERLASATDASFNIKGYVDASDDLSAQAKYMLSDLVEKLQEFDFVGEL